MSTAGNQRVTRSASKARSTGAGSTGAASVGAPSRARSRRGGSAAPLPEEDKPAVGNQVTRAYGTEGKSAQAQLLSAQIGMNQAVNPIANAVSRAQAPETPVANTQGRLAALSEEPEDGEGSNQSSRDYHIDSRPPSIGSHESETPAPAQRSWFSGLFPGRYAFNREGPNRTFNNIADSIRGHANAADESQPNRDEGWSWALFLRDALLVLSLFFGIFFGIIWVFEISRTRFGAVSGISKDVNMSAPIFQYLQHRVAKVEQHIQDLSLRTSSADAAAAKPQINWFTLGFGPSIDLFLSSPTVLGCDPTWTPQGWPWSMFQSQTCPETSLSLPHYAALSPWSDPVDDSWCAPPSNGKLQLTVVLPRTIAPTELVVEHAAMDEMPVGFMGSSPREVELWIHVPDDRARAALVEAIMLTDPSLLEDSSPQGKALGEAQALPFDFVPVGRWEYDIWTNQRLQTFALPLPLAHYGVSTAKVAVRVNSNWGNVRFTCLSRLRLYGEDTSGMAEKLDVGMAA